MIDVHVKNVNSKIYNLIDPKQIASLDNILSYYVAGYMHTKAFKRGFYNKKTKQMERWDGKKHLLTPSLSFPTGLLHHVTKYFKETYTVYTVKDLRKDPKPQPPLPIAADLDKRQYQQDCISKAIKEKNCIIQAATGSGKSFIAASIMARLNLKAVIYVHTKDLLYQMQDHIKEYLDIEAGIIGDGKIDIKHINVAMIQTVSQALGYKYVKYDDEELTIKDQMRLQDKEDIRQFVKSVELFIFDEGHHISADSCQMISSKSIKARYRMCMSGTPWRDDGADLLIEAATGKKVSSISASYLIGLGILTTPVIFLYSTKKYMGKSKDYRTIYSDHIVHNEDKNNFIGELANKMVQKNKKVLITVKYINHGHILEEIISKYATTAFVRGELDSESRKKLKEDFEAGNLQVLIATSLYDEGVNIPALDALILAGGGKSSTRALQRVGRTLRSYKGKKKSIIVDFIDDAPYLKKHSKKRISIYEQESGFELRYN